MGNYTAHKWHNDIIATAYSKEALAVQQQHYANAIPTEATTKETTPTQIEAVPNSIENFKPTGRPYTCKFCEQPGLFWVSLPIGYRLYTRDGWLHDCRDHK